MEPRPTHDMASIIILTVDDVTFTLDCVRSIAASTYPHREIVVVANGTPAPILSELEDQLSEFDEVRIIASADNLGFSAGNNFGVDASHGTYVAFVNNDMTVCPEWLDRCITALQLQTDVGAVQGMQLQMNAPDVIDCAGCYLDRYGWSVKHRFGLPREDDTTGPRYVSYASGGNFVMRRSDFDDVGRFDPAFEFYYEDGDLGWRTWISGRTVVYLPEAVVWHYGSAYHNRHTFARTNVHLRTNQLCMLVKNGAPGTLLRALPVTTTLMLASAAYFAAIGDIERAASYFRAFGGFLRRLPLTLRQRHRVQQGRTLSDVEIFRRSFYPRSAFLDESAPQAIR